MPVCRYRKGDSVPVTIAISDSDFIHLTGNHARSATEFHGFVSQLPPLNRTTFQDLDGLDSICWNQVKVSRPTLIPTSFSNNKVRATFVMSKDDVQKLKDVVLERRPNMAYVSTFTVACAHGAFKSALAWDIFWELFGSNETGNESWRIERKLNDGFLDAVQAIGEEIRKTVYNENGVLDSIRKISVVEFRSLIGKRALYVAGSPRLDVYGVDFGWEKVKKYESVNIDLYRSISIYKSREIEGGIEIGFSGSKIQMDAFTTIFKEGLRRKNSSSNPI
ncbi:hypothetical protein RD792_006190 [Penstemon davidsonii]|uniref:Uncharacterized protein n=1 Tax=Penstemon davidsonii TaxID=160366 RepID=A0ABR0DCE0_9LAMI|nr:hypothetical protein RD792_006190 [Penstemon davidsonii]